LVGLPFAATMLVALIRSGSGPDRVEGIGRPTVVGT